jgi:dipeptidyl aminopeptidase/acylaminoacyl peptidase
MDIDMNIKARGLTSWDESVEINRRHILNSYPRITKGITGAASYYSDKDGELAFAISGDNGVEKFHRYANGEWVTCPIDLDNYYYIGAGNEKDQIVVCPRARTGKPMPLQFMDAATGQLGAILVQDKAYDASAASLYRDRQTGIIVGASYGRAASHTVWFDENYKAIQKLLDASFAGLKVEIIDNNEAGNLFLVATYSDKQPTVYHWVDVAKHTGGLVKQSRPWIDAKRMQPVNVIKYKTRDGRSLDAYLSLPAGATKENPPPLVVVPPSSPWTRLYWEHDTVAQFLTSRGYAVLRPNHRGSYGYNWMFTEEDRYDFLNISDDIGDATTTLVKSGLVDPKRVAIMGTDFGAYFAIEGIVRQRDLYRCAVTIDGFFDWGDLMADMKFFQYADNSYAYFRRKLGDPRIEKDKYYAISPLNFISQAHAAVFVAHDKADANLYRAQSRRLVGELERNKLTHDTYFAPEVSTPKDRLANQVELYSRIEAFLEKNLKNAK